jgi:signal transduction histidine kinase
MVLVPSFLAFLSPTPAMAADAGAASDFLLLAIVTAAAALALAGGLWGLSEHQDNLTLRRTLRAATAKARALLSARDSWLSAGREALLVWSSDNSESVSFGNGAELMEACLTGPDAVQLSAALDGLAAQGTPFALTCRTSDGRRLAVRGRPAGGHLAVFLGPEGQHSAHDADFRGALDAMPIPAWIRAKDLSLAFVNRAFLAASGEKEEKALAANLAFDRSERDLAATAHGNSETVEAKRFATLSGQRRSLAFTLTPLADGSIAGAALDVTAITEAEARLQQHIEAHADSLDRVSTAVAIYGPDRKLAFFNRAYVRLWGLPEPWLKTHPSYSEIIDRLRELRRLPEQSDFRAWKQQRMKLFERRDSHPEEHWHLPTGQTLRVMAQPHPFGGLIFLFEDMSDQIRLESSYNTLIKVQKASLDTLQEGVAVFGPDGRLKLHNAAFARIWRLEPSELAGEPHLKRIAEACAARFSDDGAWGAVIESVTSAAPERSREWGDVERSDGSIVSLSIVPLPDGATLASFADVTDRFRIETALRERNEALEASDKLKSEFVKRMSYELRTPLNSIMGFAEMLRAGTAGPLNERQMEYADAVVKSSNALRDLVNDVLDLSEIEAGAMQLEFERVDLYLFLFGMAERAREWAAKIGLTLDLDCEADSGQFVADGRRLKQVVFNLISNAFKYTPRGGMVTLGGSIHGEDVRIFVDDTGPGVSPEIMPVAFERFSAKSGAGARAGAGLGLALVHRFIELHNGWVELESHAGQGTRVTCHLPRSLSRKNLPPPADRQARA